MASVGVPLPMGYFFGVSGEDSLTSEGLTTFRSPGLMSYWKRMVSPIDACLMDSGMVMIYSGLRTGGSGGAFYLKLC